ncbi:siphovirus Gp157 family protein [Paenibacillus tianjinensis]|uniref:Siphovirus Gp157 family protein n=1 Tax=Paenibacillus tianjinensis TaxID=2810347 RepID=A0ABX7L7V0_9BACL|nr:siphovirus Gp157 family protein [Paenibacillus tianjinensis]QSF43443.1 siphovirus Gp157 family protein [Paenibacillus tianjinensis]
MPALYTLGEQYRVFNQYVDAAWDSEDLTEDDLQSYIDTLESIEDEINSKVENITKFMKNIEGDIEAFKAEEARLARKRKYLENKHKGLKTYMQSVLEVNNIDKVNAGTFKVSIHKTNPSVGIIDEKLIPDTFKIPQEAKLDSKALLAALKKLKDGETIDGAVLVTDKKHIRIS